jgi:hypothetical protein
VVIDDASQGTPHRAGDLTRLEGVKSLTLRDPGWGFALNVTLPAAGLWIIPIEVVSASEAGFERTFQGVSLLTVWPLRLEPGAAWEAKISFAVRPI